MELSTTEFYVYVLQSENDKSYYKGFTENPIKRLERHNNGDSAYTRGKMPWKLIHLEKHELKSIALKREKSLKKYSHSQLENLFQSPLNYLSKFYNAS